MPFFLGGGEDAASSSAAPLASPEDLTDISTSCGSSVQSACFEAPSTKETSDLLTPVALPAQIGVVVPATEESTSLAPDHDNIVTISPNLVDAAGENAVPAGSIAVTPVVPEEINNPRAPQQPTETAASVVPAAGAPPGVPVMMPMHPDQQPVMIIDHSSMIPYGPVPPTFPMPPVPMHLPDGTDLDLSKPPPIPPSQHMYGQPAPYPGAYALPYPYPYPHMVSVDPNYPTNYQTILIQQPQPDGTMVMIPYMTLPGVMPAQPLQPPTGAPPGGAVPTPGLNTDAAMSGSGATPPASGVVPNAPLPPMPAAGVTPLAAVEGTPNPDAHPPTQEFQRSFSQEATESLKSLLNINSDTNSPSNLQHQSAAGMHMNHQGESICFSKVSETYLGVRVFRELYSYFICT